MLVPQPKCSENKVIASDLLLNDLFKLIAGCFVNKNWALQPAKGPESFLLTSVTFMGCLVVRIIHGISASGESSTIAFDVFICPIAK